jgi:hypothetical protein
LKRSVSRLYSVYMKGRRKEEYPMIDFNKKGTVWKILLALLIVFSLLGLALVMTKKKEAAAREK